MAGRLGVLIRELGALYTAFANNQRSPLPELPIQYADFAHWQREWLARGKYWTPTSSISLLEAATRGSSTAESPH